MIIIKKKRIVNESEEYILRSFMSADYPSFAKSNELANDNVEYLLGLCQRCLNGDINLSFPLNFIEEDEYIIQQFIKDRFDNSDEWLFFYLMK